MARGRCLQVPRVLLKSRRPTVYAYWVCLLVYDAIGGRELGTRALTLVLLFPDIFP